MVNILYYTFIKSQECITQRLKVYKLWTLVNHNVSLFIYQLKQMNHTNARC